jgi:hypothetical protein
MTTTIASSTRAIARVLLVATCFVALATTDAAAAATPTPTPRTCVSHDGLPEFAIAGKPPAKNRGLTFCADYGKSTCCDKGTTDAIRRVVAHMQANSFSPRCRDAWTSLECSVCDPRAGTTPRTAVCAHACDAIYRACKDEYFSEDSLRRLVPCRASDTICTKLSDWGGDGGGGDGDDDGTGTNGDEWGGEAMCRAAGYDPVRAGVVRAQPGGWCFEPPAPDAHRRSGPGSGSGSSKSDGGGGASGSKKAGKGAKKRGGKAADAEDYAAGTPPAWMTKAYVLIAVAAALYVGLRAARRGGSAGASLRARHNARMAAESRAGRARDVDKYL